MNNLDLFSVFGKRAVVTGATSGMGRAMAECLLVNGCNVIAVGRNTEKAKDLLSIGKENNAKCILVSCDLTSEEQVNRLAEKVQEEFDNIDILINAAGGGEFAFLESLSLDSFRRTLDKTLTSKFLVIKAISNLMKKQNYGRIISISSMSSFVGTSGCGNAAYCAAMGGVNAMTRQLACEFAPFGITINAIAPTFMNTPYVSQELKNNPVFAKSLQKKIPLGRIAETKDILGLCMLLSSDASAFITGITFPLDGGLSARGADNEEFSIPR